MKLYVYDHCPYCVKARMIFGLKQVPFTLITLLNDDEETPIRMIGKKMVPILEKAPGDYMPESMDIVHAVDQMSGTAIVDRNLQSAALTKWLEESRTYLYKLAMPRWVKAPLEEFKTEAARQYFIQKKEAMLGSFDTLWAESAELKRQAQSHLDALEPLIQAPDAVHGDLSDDDFHLFAALRSLSVVKGLSYKKKVDDYRKNMALRTDIPLHDGISIE